MRRLVVRVIGVMVLLSGTVLAQSSSGKPPANPKQQKAEGYTAASAAKTQFMRESGYRNGRPGYVVAYRKTLACGGKDDDISNMEWLTVAEAKAKEKAERNGCKP